MNQNVIGLILFSLIVGTAVFISSLFVSVPRVETVKVAPTKVIVSRTNCGKIYKDWNPIGTAEVRVVQAILNQQTNQLDTDFFIKKEDSEIKSVGIALHFFVQDERSTQYLATETITVTPAFDKKGRANHNVISSYQWLDDLKQRDNLYVIAESTTDFNHSRSIEPNFSVAKAVPILLLRDR